MTFQASRQDGTHPRPQLLRRRHLSLDVLAGFAFDDEDRGRVEHWESDARAFDRDIQLPFPPESPASGIGVTGYHPVAWYRIPFTAADLTAAGRSEQVERVLLHFGAVDHSADVWVDGNFVGRHDGGQTPFSIDITEALTPEASDHYCVVRSEDDPHDVTQPRGKQDWQLEPHSIWYHRTSGIWRTVWLEAVPALRIDSVAWIADVKRASVRAEIEWNCRPSAPVELTLRLDYEGESLADITVLSNDRRLSVDVPLDALRHGQHYEHLLWSPEHPRLIDAELVLHDGNRELDHVWSYLGLRSVGVERGRFLLNNRPYFVRSVLEQGYWPESHLTPPSVDALREEVELIRRLGFNTTRVHQKAEDPRFLYWADRLGLLVWGETASAFEFGTVAVERLTREWLDLVRRDRSHPSIVTWVPFNESWGIQHVAYDPAQAAFSRALMELTRALDPTRPVISNDGWEHSGSDILTIHDYEWSGEVLAERYGSRESIDALVRGIGPAGRRLVVHTARVDPDQPIMLTEFGGVSFAPATELDDSWGYSTARDEVDFEARLRTMFDAVNASPVLAGFCYTQLTDTRQETNGLCDEHRTPKIDAEWIARLVRE